MQSEDDFQTLMATLQQQNTEVRSLLTLEPKIKDSRAGSFVKKEGEKSVSEEQAACAWLVEALQQPPSAF